jgi:N4-gp56 family major capsid protein
MAQQTFGVNAPETVKLWSKLLMTEVDKALELGPMIGRSKDAPITLLTETQKEAGDRVRCTMAAQLNGVGVSEGETLHGTEETRATYTDDVVINELFHAVDVITEGSIDNQRVIHNMRSDAKDALRDWFGTRFSNAFFMHAGGYLGTSITVEGDSWSLTGASKGKYTLFNDPIAATNIIRPSTHTTDQAITSSDTFTLSMIDRAVNLAKTANPKIRPIMVNGRRKYVMYLHPDQVYSLRTTTGEGTWQDFAKRGPEHKERIYDGAIGEYAGVILREHEHVAPGYNASTNAEIATVRRAVMVGAGSCAIAFGKGGGYGRYKWREQASDYDRTLGVGVGCIVGMKKTQYNSKDWGAVVVSTYANV